MNREALEDTYPVLVVIPISFAFAGIFQTDQVLAYTSLNTADSSELYLTEDNSNRSSYKVK